MKFKRRFTYQHFKRYFSNSLPDKEQHAFEKSMMQDAFESEAFDGLSQLSPEEMEQDLADLQLQLQKTTKTKKRRIPVWFAYAASVILLIGIGASLFFANQYFTHENMVEERVVQSLKEDTTPKNEKAISPKVKEKSGKQEKKEPSRADTEVAGKNIQAPTKKVLVKEKEEKILSEEETLEIVLDEEEYEQDIIEEDSKKVEVPKLKMAKKKRVAILESENEIPQTKIVSQQKTLEGKVTGVLVTPSASDSGASLVRYSRGKTFKTISGIVLSQNKEPIPGSSIILKGTTLGTTTNIDGEFKLEVPQHSSETLTASYIGCNSKEIPITQDSNLIIHLEENTVAMNEVIVTGFDKDNSKAEIIKAKPMQSSIRQYKKELLRQLDYEKLSEFPGTHRIKFSFVVEKDGSLSDFQFEQSPNKSFEKEIIRAIMKGEKWQAQLIDQEPIKSSVKLTLKIHID